MGKRNRFYYSNCLEVSNKVVKSTKIIQFKLVSGNKNAVANSLVSSMICPESLISSHLKPIFSYGKMVIFQQTATGHECPGLGLPRECGGKVQLLESSEFGGNKLGGSPAKNGGFIMIYRLKTSPKMGDFPGSEIGHFAT